MSSRSSWVSWLILLLASCAPPTDPTEAAELAASEVNVSTEAREVKMQVDGLTIWVRTTLRAAERDGRRVWVLRGRAGGNLEGVASFILGDGFGRAHLAGARSFEVDLDGHETNSLLSGLRLFVEIRSRSPRARPATLMVQLAPTLVGGRGDAAIDVSPQLAPVNVGGELRYRGEVRGPTSAALTGTSSSGDLLALTPTSAGVWALDLPFDLLEAEAARRGRARLVLHGTSRTSKLVDVGLVVGEADLFRGDAESRFPGIDACSPDVQACLDAIPDHTVDYATCGAYRQVAACNVPAVLPALGLIEHEEVDPILEEAAAVRTRLAPAMIVYVNPFYVQGWSEVPPTARQVVRSWVTSLQVTGALDEGEQAAESWRAELQEWQALSILETGARAVYGDEVPLVTRLRTDTTTFLLAYYPEAARLLAVELVSR